MHSTLSSHEGIHSLDIRILSSLQYIIQNVERVMELVKDPAQIRKMNGNPYISRGSHVRVVSLFDVCLCPTCCDFADFYLNLPKPQHSDIKEECVNRVLSTVDKVWTACSSFDPLTRDISVGKFKSSKNKVILDRNSSTAEDIRWI